MTMHPRNLHDHELRVPDRSTQCYVNGIGPPASAFAIATDPAGFLYQQNAGRSHGYRSAWWQHPYDPITLARYEYPGPHVATQ